MASAADASSSASSSAAAAATALRPLDAGGDPVLVGGRTVPLEEFALVAQGLAAVMIDRSRASAVMLHNSLAWLLFVCW